MELAYLLKVTVCTIIFYTVYQLFLAKLTFFRVNRFYLLFALVLSFAIPAMSFTVEKQIEIPKILLESSVVKRPFVERVSEVSLNTLALANKAETHTPINWVTIITNLYLLVAVVILTISVFKLWQLLRYVRSAKKDESGLKLISKTEGFTNCSFFNYVFVDDRQLTAQELQLVLRHESIHAEQFHSADKLLLMIVKAVLWFNPIIYFYRTALEQLHEYEADEGASSNFGTVPYADLLLRLSLTERHMPLVHNFVKSPIKKRIQMLFHQKSIAMKKLIYLSILPALFVLFCGFSLDFVAVSKDGTYSEDEVLDFLESDHSQLLADDSSKNSKMPTNPIAIAENIKQFFDRSILNPLSVHKLSSPTLSNDHVDMQSLFSVTEEKEFVLVIDAGHGGKQHGSIVNGIAEKDLTLEMAKLVKALAEQKGIKVLMTRTNDSDIKLTDRVQLKGDLLISLHVNSMPENSKVDQDGIEIFLPAEETNNQDKLKASKEIGNRLLRTLAALKDIRINDEMKPKKLFVLSKFEKASLALELGFLTNPSDFKFITSKVNQEKLAGKIVDAVNVYRNSQQKTGLNVRGLKQNIVVKQTDTASLPKATASQQSRSSEEIIRNFMKANPKLKTISVSGKSVVLSKNIDLEIDDISINAGMLTYSDDDRKLIAKQAVITDHKGNFLVKGAGLEYDLDSRKYLVTQAKGTVRKL